MPTIFFGHGSPMNTLEENRYTQAWQYIGQTLPRPKAILFISAHWYVGYTAVTAMETPRTIHDFRGFPKALAEFQYPAPGSPSLAAKIADLLHPLNVHLDETWGLDHGAWSVLAHVYPNADVPVVQLSIDRTQQPQFHYQLGKRLAPLRDAGILILGSGNIVHNLRAMLPSGSPPYPWATRFHQAVKDKLLHRQHASLTDYEALDSEALLSVPTPEHYLPLLYIAALQQDNENISFPIDDLDMGSMSMLTVAIGENF